MISITRIQQAKLKEFLQLKRRDLGKSLSLGDVILATCSLPT
jgi:hypothetical protein